MLLLLFGYDDAVGYLNIISFLFIYTSSVTDRCDNSMSAAFLIFMNSPARPRLRTDMSCVRSHWPWIVRRLSRCWPQRRSTIACWDVVVSDSYTGHRQRKHAVCSMNTPWETSIMSTSSVVNSAGDRASSISQGYTDSWIQLGTSQRSIRNVRGTA